MTNIDQFESVFKSADKAVFRYRSVAVDKVCVITDRDPDGAREFGRAMRSFLKAVAPVDGASWNDIPGEAFSDISELLDLVSRESPDLICTYRNLHSTSWKYPYTLGSHLMALTQEVRAPILVAPHPEAERAAVHALRDTDVVMAITDHLAGDDRLVNVAARFTQPSGTLWLTHVEDRTHFDYYMETISRIPALDTDTARETLALQLLKQPRDYIGSCRRVLKEAGVPLDVKDLVTMGSRLDEYRGLIHNHKADLLVFRTRDEDQLAMHGLAYPLAVELRQIPLLLL